MYNPLTYFLFLIPCWITNDNCCRCLYTYISKIIMYYDLCFCVKIIYYYIMYWNDICKTIIVILPIKYAQKNIDQFENGQSIILLRHVIQHLHPPPPPKKRIVQLLHFVPIILRKYFLERFLSLSPITINYFKRQFVINHNACTEKTTSAKMDALFWNKFLHKKHYPYTISLTNVVLKI